MCSCYETKLLEQALHYQTKVVVMLVERSQVVAPWPRLGVAACGKQRLDDLLAQDQQCGQGLQGLGRDLVATAERLLVDKLLGTKFLQIVSGTASSVFVQT